MATCWIDHLVITASSLAAGAAYVRESLGVDPGAGGQHATMGTHNLLLRLGERAYLEVIAADPESDAPDRPRWYGLDRIPAGSDPRLTAWVAATDNIHMTAAASFRSPGLIEEMSRGDYRWLVTIPKGGRLVADGIGPMIIQWLNKTHPATTLRDSGCSLIQLTGHHPQVKRIESTLERIGFEGPFSVVAIPEGEAPHLVARIQTPSGERVLRSP